MRRDGAVGEISCSGVKKEACLHGIVLKQPLKFLVGKQFFFNQGIGFLGRKMRHDTLNKLPCRIPCGMNQHGIQIACLQADDFSDGID